MRLTVQSFQRRFSPEDPNINQKMKDYSETLIQQIDTMSAVASAFSNFASMPAQQNETLNVVEVVELALDIFNENNILFEKESAVIISKIDRTQLVRIITNLVKNAIQSIPEMQEYKRIRVAVKKSKIMSHYCRRQRSGINPTDINRIFQPKFTTKK
jgi:nitrogen fixation/metabolism regulation signal transduction histidine kinase